MTALTPAFTPAHLKGMVIDPSDPFKLDFLIHRGDEPMTEEQKRVAYPRLIRYFLASLAIPDTDQWVNLSPYEKDRIIPDNFGFTAMGRDLLAQDYLLKQVAASLTNPDTELGRKFWDGVYSRAYQKFGTTDIPTDIFNKVWITPDKAVLYEKGNTVYVLEHHLKVMMEKDYLAAKAGGSGSTPSDENGSAAISQEVMRSIIVPAIEKEVNEGKNFAKLRQVYSGMLLAAWYKRALKNSILAHVYADRSKVKGIDQNPANNQKIYAQYVAAFKAGACNMIKEDMDRFTQEVIPRKYFSGGMVADGAMFEKIVERTARLSAKDMADAGKIDASEVMLKRAEAMPGEVFRKTLGSAYVIPEVDLFDPLYQSIRRSIFDLGDSRFNLNPLFVKYMAATIFSLCREHEKRHMWVLSAIFQARLLAASNRAVLAERPVEDSLRAAVNTRLLGLPDEQRGVRYSDISSKGRYAVLYVMLCQRLAAEGFNMESIPEGTRYTRAQEIGATGESYWQVLERYNEKVRIYKAPDIIIPSILAHLQQLWDKMMADDLDKDQRVSALAEYEWWFFQANPFGRGGASIGDAMSLVAQSKMGLPLRARFEHLDFRALSMTLPEYKADRSAELTKGLKKHHEGPSVGDQADGSMTFDSSDDAAKGPWDKRLRFHKSRVPDFDPDDPLQEKIRTAISVEEDSKFHSNDEFGAVMAAAAAFLARDSEKKHLPILGLVYKARLSVVLLDPDFDEYKFALILRDALTSRLLGFAKDKGWGVPNTPMSPSGRYGQLYDKVRKRLALEGFVKETLPDMVRYYVLQEIGKTGKFYRQMIVVKDDGRIRLYHAEHADVPAIMRRLTECWDSVMDESLTRDARLAALAEYEWWFIQANPFGRGAASMTDAMSFVALLKMGMPIRKQYEHADFRVLSMTLSEYIEDRVAELKKNVPDQSQTAMDVASDLSAVKLIWSGHIQQPNGSEVVVDKQGQVALRFAMALNDKQMPRERLDRYLKSIKGSVRFSHVDIDEGGISYRDWSAPESDLPLVLTATDERDGDGNYILEARFTPPSAFARLEFNLRFVAPGGEEVWLRNDTQNNNFTLFNSVGMKLMPGLLGQAIAEMPYIFITLDEPFKKGSKKTLRQALIQSKKLAKFVLEMGSYYSGRERKILELFHEVNHKRVTQSPEDVEHICRDGFSWGKAESYFNGRSIWTFVNNGNRALLKFLQESDSWVKISFDGDVVSDSSVSLIRNEMFKVFDNDEFDHNLWHLAPYLIDVVAYIYGIDGISFRGDDWLLIKSERPIEDIRRFPDQAATTSKRKVTGSNSGSSDMAEKVVQPGGIDFAASNLDMQIKRDGAGVPLPVAQQDLDNIHIDGLVPVIVNIRPAAGLPLFNGAGAAAMEGK